MGPSVPLHIPACALLQPVSTVVPGQTYFLAGLSFSLLLPPPPSPAAAVSFGPGLTYYMREREGEREREREREREQRRRQSIHAFEARGDNNTGRDLLIERERVERRSFRRSGKGERERESEREVGSEAVNW